MPNRPEIEAAFEAAPEDHLVELVDGELHVHPRPARAHINVASNLVGSLVGPFRWGEGGGPGGWVILFEPEVHLGPRPDKLVPDVAGWRRERLPRAVGGPNVPAHYDLSPDWVCEVLSERTRSHDRIRKMRIYAREGVGHVWLIDPVERTLEVFRLQGPHWVLIALHEGDATVRLEPFEAVEMDLQRLWSE